MEMEMEIEIKQLWSFQHALSEIIPKNCSRSFEAPDRIYLAFLELERCKIYKLYFVCIESMKINIAYLYL